MSSAARVTIEYGLPTASETSAIARLLGEVFSRRDPPAYAMGLTAGEFEDFARLLCPKAITDGLTIVARRADTRELVGVMLTEDCASPMPDGMDRLSRKFDPILDILGQLGTEYWGERQARPGEALHLFLLGVAEGFGGQGVAQRLVTDCLERGACRGYRLRSQKPPTRFRSTSFANWVLWSASGVRMRAIVTRG